MPEQGSAGSTRGLWPVYVTLRGCVTYPKIMRAGGERRTQAGWQRPAWVLGRVLGWSKRRGPGEGEKSWREVSWSAGEMLLTGQWATEWCRIWRVYPYIYRLRRPYLALAVRYPNEPISAPYWVAPFCGDRGQATGARRLYGAPRGPVSPVPRCFGGLVCVLRLISLVQRRYTTLLPHKNAFLEVSYRFNTAMEGGEPLEIVMVGKSLFFCLRCFLFHINRLVGSGVIGSGSSRSVKFRKTLSEYGARSRGRCRPPGAPCRLSGILVRKLLAFILASLGLFGRGKKFYILDLC